VSNTGISRIGLYEFGLLLKDGKGILAKLDSQGHAHFLQADTLPTKQSKRKK